LASNAADARLGARSLPVGFHVPGKEMLARLVDNFEEIIAAGTNPQKKDLLRRLLKKVLVHDKRTIEIRYALPNQASVRRPGNPAPVVDDIRTSRVRSRCHC
jgi:hypothetical protein